MSKGFSYIGILLLLGVVIWVAGAPPVMAVQIRFSDGNWDSAVSTDEGFRGHIVGGVWSQSPSGMQLLSGTKPGGVTGRYYQFLLPEAELYPNWERAVQAGFPSFSLSAPATLNGSSWNPSHFHTRNLALFLLMGQGKAYAMDWPSRRSNPALFSNTGKLREEPELQVSSPGSVDRHATSLLWGLALLLSGLWINHRLNRKMNRTASETMESLESPGQSLYEKGGPVGTQAEAT